MFVGTYEQYLDFFFGNSPWRTVDGADPRKLAASIAKAIDSGVWERNPFDPNRPPKEYMLRLKQQLLAGELTQRIAVCLGYV